MTPLSGFSASLIRQLGNVVAPGGTNGSLLVLIFHRVLPETDPLMPGEPDTKSFAAQMDLIRATCTVLPLSEAIERLYSGSLPERATCITFDDGYANNLTMAAPILKARGLPATVFVATGFLNGGRMWNDTVIESVRQAGEVLDLTSIDLGTHRLPDVPARRRAIEAIISSIKYLDPAERPGKAAAVAECARATPPSDLMMTDAQVRELLNHGIEVGAHTLTHPILARTTEDDAWREIAGSKSVLEDMTGGPIKLFAYPNGRPHQDYARTHVEMVRKAGFTAAVSTAWGASQRTSDRYQLPRMLPWDKSPLKYAARLLRTHRERRAETV
jgi:peptidoglycan/xylan/chitin deacetylase (PgdA/CDA1 family)